MGLYVLITVLILIIAVLLVLVVLVQNSKGGGLASNFAGSNQYMGVRKTADFLEKSTWTLAIAMLFLVLISSKVIPKYDGKIESLDTEIRGAIEDIPIPTVPFDPAENTTPENTGSDDGGDNNE